jgi:hypothetical protein
MSREIPLVLSSGCAVPRVLACHAETRAGEDGLVLMLSVRKNAAEDYTAEDWPKILLLLSIARFDMNMGRADVSRH